MDPVTDAPGDGGGAEAAGAEGADAQKTPVNASGANPDGAEGEAAPKKDPDFDFNVPLPEIIHIDRMARISDVKSIWRSGIKQIEEIFSDHIAKINDLFDDRALEYDRIRDQLITNHEFLKRFYMDMQAKLNEKQAEIQREREEWEKDKAEIAAMVKLDSEVVALNVGGTHKLMTERDVLRLVPGSTLEKMFNGLHELKKIDEEVFLDRDGKTFQFLVNYLRNDREVFPEFVDPNDEIHFFKELDFWKIPTRQHTARKMPLTNPVVPDQTPKPLPKPNQMGGGAMGPPKPVVKSKGPPAYNGPTTDDDPFNDVRSEDSHGVALKAAKDKWNELGPLRLEDIVKNSQEQIDQHRQFGQSSYNKYIIGQLGPNGKVTGVGKEINHIIYEGQFKDDIYNGFGRFIYSNGNYYIGNWLDGKRSGYGKLVDKSGRVYEGQWQYSKFMGDQ